MKKQIFLAIVVYTFLSFLQPLSNLILLPVYTGFFTESEFGTFSVLNNLNIFFTIIGGLNLVNAIIAFYSKFSDTEESLNRYMGNILSFTFYINLIFLGLMCLIGESFFRLIFKEEIHFFPNGLLIIAYGLFSNIIIGYLYFMKYEKRLGRFAFLTLLLFVLNTVLQYIFIVHLNGGISGTFLSRVIATAVVFIIILGYNFRYFFARIEYKKYIKASLRYSTITLFASCFSWVSNYSDRFFIERFIDLKTLGIYSLLTTITSLSEIGFFALGSALQPFIFDYYKADDKKGAQRLYQIFILLAACIVSFIILLGSNIDLFITNNGYIEVVKYLSLMAIGHMFSPLYYIFNLQIIYAKNSRYLIYIGIYLLVLSLLLNSFFIPIYGIWGAVLATFFLKFLSVIVIYYYARKSILLPFQKMNYVILGSFILLILGFWILSSLNIISYNLGGILQFLSVLSIILIVFRKMLHQFYILFLQKLKKGKTYE